MISLRSIWVAPPNNQVYARGKERPGDGYAPPYAFGTYALLPYVETDLPRRDPGRSWPWAPATPDYPPGMGTTRGVQRAFAFSAMDAARRPGITGTDVGQGTDPRTTWAPYYTIQQQAIQKSLYQRTAHA